MKPKFIFLHIPKAAGTSFRAMLWNLTIPQERFWYGMDTNPRVTSYSGDILEGRRFIGGHKGIKFYPESEPNLYCSLMRDPVARVVSLFSYYTRPESGTDERSFKRRSKQLERWLELGIDPDSIVRSLETCQPFRNEVENHQCAYLGIQGRSFESALETLSSRNFVVGDSRQLGLFTGELSELLSWPELKNTRGNVTRKGGHSGILDEDGAEDLIRELCREDQKLYDFITKDHRGLFVNLPSRALLKEHLSYQPPTAGPAFSRSAWEKIEIRSPSELKVQPGEAANLDILLENNSKEVLPSGLGEGVFFAFKLLDADGKVSKVNGLRTPLSNSVAAGGVHRQSIEVKIPAGQLHDTHSIRLGILVRGSFWVEQFSPHHTVTLRLLKEDE